MWTRRQFLSLGIAGWAISQGFSRKAQARQPMATRTVPRYFLVITPSGGMDGVYTTDPKTRSEVEPWVDVRGP